MTCNKDIRLDSNMGLAPMKSQWCILLIEVVVFMGVKVEMLETLQDLKAVHSNLFVYNKVAMLALCTLV